MHPKFKTFEELLDRYVPIRQPGQCWLWTGWRHPKGYGSCYWRKKTYFAHRLVYQQIVGPVPQGLELDHTCKNPSCCNPAHLEPVTHLENVRRGYFSQKTHCSKGHNYDAVNTYITKDKHRVCRECHRQMELIRYHRKTSEQRLQGIRLSPSTA